MNSLTDSPADIETGSAASSVDAVRILADDLTGACDSAAAFVSAGRRVRVWLGAAAVEDFGEPVQAFNTASRGLAGGSAAETVSRAAAGLAGGLPTGRQTLWFKKVDSAGRGAIAAEVLVAHRALGTRAVLFAPSFPEAGRTVRGGILEVEDPAGHGTQISLLRMFEEDAATALITDASQIERAAYAGVTVLVCDASTQEELERLAAVDEPGLLYAGSAGLAKALARVRMGVDAVPEESLPVGVRTMTICGTAHPVTRMQLEHLADAVPGHSLLQIRAETSDAATIQDYFARRDPGALILTGGDTALLALTALGAHSIMLHGEAATGIPWGVIQGGLADGRIVITKSGGFGAADSLTRIVRRLTGESVA